jgi:hypothetical protein
MTVAQIQDRLLYSCLQSDLADVILCEELELNSL